MPRPINTVTICALAVAIAGAGAANAETRVRIRNDSVHPANISVDKRSRDVRPRKAASFPITGTTGMLAAVFANGDVSKGEFDVREALPVQNAEDGNTYYCIVLDTEDFNVMPQADCAAAVSKVKK